MEKFTYYSRSVPSFTAMSSYSCLFLAISSRQPKQVSWEAATREARVSPAVKKDNNCTSENTNSTQLLMLFMFKYPKKKNIYTMQMRHVQTSTSLIFYHFALNIASSTYDFTWKCFFQGDFKKNKEATHLA